jgi:hypothetical protein
MDALYLTTMGETNAAANKLPIEKQVRVWKKKMLLYCLGGWLVS